MLAAPNPVDSTDAGVVLAGGRGGVGVKADGGDWDLTATRSRTEGILPRTPTTDGRTTERDTKEKCDLQPVPASRHLNDILSTWGSELLHHPGRDRISQIVVVTYESVSGRARFSSDEPTLWRFQLVRAAKARTAE